MTEKLGRNDVVRSLIHGGGITTVWMSMYGGRAWVLLLIVAVTAAYCASEYLRMRGRDLPILNKITLAAARRGEAEGFLTAPIYYACGIFLSLSLFPEPVSYATIAIFTLGDPMVYIVGRSMGKHRVPYNPSKYLEGSIGGFISASLASSLFVQPTLALLGSAIGMFVESLRTPVDDNLAMPVATGLGLIILSAIPS
ncbi:MAG: diacylglycerol/polyprenol kinase family protein [Candidatus Geothermarchaeales archaeon]